MVVRIDRYPVSADTFRSFCANKVTYAGWHVRLQSLVRDAADDTTFIRLTADSGQPREFFIQLIRTVARILTYGSPDLSRFTGIWRVQQPVLGKHDVGQDRETPSGASIDTGWWNSPTAAVGRLFCWSGTKQMSLQPALTMMADVFGGWATDTPVSHSRLSTQSCRGRCRASGLSWATVTDRALRELVAVGERIWLPVRRIYDHLGFCGEIGTVRNLLTQRSRRQTTLLTPACAKLGTQPSVIR